MSRMADLLTTEIESLLHLVANNEGIDNYDAIFDIAALRGDGFLGELYFATILNRDTDQVLELAVKKAFKHVQKREELNMRSAYFNEVLFYSKVFPTLSLLQTEAVQEPFVEIARFYYATMEEFYEALVMDNLKAQGYIMREKEKLLDEQHAALIFKTYGKFHALSFAFKDQFEDEYRKVVGDFKDFLTIQFTAEGMADFFSSICKSGFEALDPVENADIIENCGKCYKKAFEEFRKIAAYDGEFAVVTHGDNWANNLMYKYTDSGELESMKLIDFQMAREGTPVYDLSYFFYSGGSKELFDKLHDFLLIYHDSLSKNLRELGSDPEKLYPFEQLLDDWKNYAFFGVIMSLIIVKVKLLQRDDVQNIVRDDDDGSTMISGMLKATVDMEVFNKRVKDILIHAYEENVLRGID